MVDILFDNRLLCDSDLLRSSASLEHEILTFELCDALDVITVESTFLLINLSRPWLIVTKLIDLGFVRLGCTFAELIIALLVFLILLKPE